MPHMPVFGIQPAGLLQTIFEDIGTAVAVIDKQGRFVFANRPAMDLFGIDDHKGQRFQDWRQSYRFENPMGHEISLEDSAVMRALNGERVESQEIRVILPDGNTKCILGWAYPFSVAGLAGVLAITLDETSDVQLRRVTSQLQRMETLGALAIGLTHDFNNILDTISLNAELALREAGQSPSSRFRLEQISAATRTASGLVNRLMQFSRARSFRIQTLQINDVIEDVLHLLHPLLRQTISVHTNLSEGLSPIQADRSQIEQVLINLIVNALDAMPTRGQLTISTAPGASEELIADSARRYITIVVADTGSGIPPHLQTTIFDPFFTTKAAGKGTGLGLSTVQAIVREHNGKIRVRSTLGAGAAFIISLPARPETIAEQSVARNGQSTSVSVKHDR
jgi:two-component system cell cycle sensor histidine kinase/response regulator CckA